MDRYNNREWLLLRVGCSSMTGVAMVSLMVGMTGMVLGSRTFMLAAAAGMAAAGLAGGVMMGVLARRGDPGVLDVGEASGLR
ncbi:MAG: hypothetical protein J4G03_09010, partial [Gemmatimonadetes bacterium]|nr:hypothetical protein [Gemmatimonadota bacterium]